MRSVIGVPLFMMVLVLATLVIGGCSLHTSVKSGEVYFHLSTGDNTLD